MTARRRAGGYTFAAPTAPTRPAAAPDAGAQPGTSTVPDAGTGTLPDAGTGPGTRMVAEPGTAAGTGAGTDAGTRPAADPGTRTGTGRRRGAGTRAGERAGMSTRAGARPGPNRAAGTDADPATLAAARRTVDLEARALRVALDRADERRRALADAVDAAGRSGVPADELRAVLILARVADAVEVP
jgi:hypothetical protein